MRILFEAEIRLGREEKAIAIACRMDSVESINLAKKIMNFLQKRGENVALESRICKRLGDPDLGMNLRAMTEDAVKFLISVGGDGSILRVFHNLPKKNMPPVLGVAKTGSSIAFLSESSEKTVFNDLSMVLENKYIIEKCPRLATYLSKSPNTSIRLGDALNEVLLSSIKPSKVMQISVKVNGEFLNYGYLDGLILSTATGSTAYAFSAGGSIMAPSIEAIHLVPLNTYARSGLVPMMFPKDSEFEITLLRDKLMGTLIIDGQRAIMKVFPRNKIRVKMSEEIFKLIRVGKNINKSFFYRLREKILPTLRIPFKPSMKY